MSYGKKRDANERAIIVALRLAGASVHQLQGTGEPDLLVGFEGVTYLMEIKDPTQANGKAHKRSDGPMSELTPAQVRWWTAWAAPANAGPPPVIVHTPEAALRIIGATK
jgi:hypothetical protein